MRLSRRFAPVLAALGLLLALPWDAVSDTTENARHARVAPAPEVTGEPFGAACRTKISGSEAVAHCHNPYPETDRLRLHVECARWWDIDTDGRPVAADPAMTVRLSGRCWKEIRAVWVSHRK